MIIQADEDTLQRLTGLESPDQFPPELVAEYELRLYMFHADGHSGPLGTIGIIDLLRFLGMAPPSRVNHVVPGMSDWSRVPTDGTVRVEARWHDDDAGIDEWVPGVYLGAVGIGRLAVRLDGNTYVDEFSRKDVRHIREKIPALIAEPEKAEPPPPAWVGVKRGERVYVEEKDDVKDGAFQKFQQGRVWVLVSGETRGRPFAPEQVTRTTREEPAELAEA